MLSREGNQQGGIEIPPIEMRKRDSWVLSYGPGLATPGGGEIRIQFTRGRVSGLIVSRNLSPVARAP
jgi:hypothetical protein